MPQGHQVAIAGPSALTRPSQSLPGGTVTKGQHNVPRFLLKIYEYVNRYLPVRHLDHDGLRPMARIVNDPTNESLIKWSEAGDSFYSV